VEFPESVARNIDRYPSIFSCAMGHLLVIKNAYDNNHKTVVFLEDDVELGLWPWFTRGLDTYLTDEEQGPYWNIAQLVSLGPVTDWSSSSARLDFLPKADHKHLSYGAVAYAMSRRGMDIMMKEFWNSTAQKFNLTSILAYRWCKIPSADNCLLGLEPNPGRWLSNLKLLPNSTQSVPVYFYTRPIRGLHKVEPYLCSRVLVDNCRNRTESVEKLAA